MEWHKSIIDIANVAKLNGLVLYGAGFWGDKALQIFSLFDVNPLCFCDDDKKKHGTKKNEVLCISLEEAVELYPQAVYLVCVDETPTIGNYEREARTNMIQKLKEYGVYSKHTEIHLAYYIFLLDIDIQAVSEEITAPETKEFFIPEDINHILLFNNMSNSGAYYFEQLVDGHENFLFLPYIESLQHVYEKRMRFLTGEELLIEMAAQLLGYFHSHVEEEPFIRMHKFQNFCMDAQGVFRKEVLVHPDDFLYWLKVVLQGKKTLESYAEMLKLYFTAYANCLGRKKEKNQEYWLFYHMHLANYDVHSTYQHIKPTDFQRIENLIIIREPVQHLYSWIKRVVLQQKNRKTLSGSWFSNVLKSDLGEMVKRREGIDNVRVIRFEDLKHNNEKTMLAFCQWLDIPYSENMKETTLNGYQIYFPANTPSGVKYITGNDLTAVNSKDFSEVMTKWDEVRFNIFFGRFKYAYGYDVSYPDLTKFSVSFLEEVLEEPFKMESLVSDLFKEKGKETLADGQVMRDVIKQVLLNEAKSDLSRILWYKYIGQEFE